MVSIRQNYDSGSGGTKCVVFIRCIDGHDPQIHEICCLGYDGITHEIHPTAQVDIGAGAVGQFTTNCLAENGR